MERDDIRVGSTFNDGFTVRIEPHGRDERRWATLSVYGFKSGRFGSQLVVEVPLDQDDLPTDPERLLSLILDGLYAAVYHT